MSKCPKGDSCPFMRAVEPSIVKRVKYAAAYPFCRGGTSAQCALMPYLQRGETPPPTLLPTGGHDAYADRGPHSERTVRVMVVDESHIFRSLMEATVTSALPHAEIVVHDSLATALGDLGSRTFDLLVCADSFASGGTAQDLRNASGVPMVILAADEGYASRAPAHSYVVARNAGPEAVRAAIESSLAG